MEGTREKIDAGIIGVECKVNFNFPRFQREVYVFGVLLVVLNNDAHIN